MSLALRGARASRVFPGATDTAFSLLSLLLCVGLATTASAQTPTDLGTLDGYTQGRAKNIDNRRNVVGQAVRPGPVPTEQAVLWRHQHGGDYAVEALPALSGLDSSDARDFAGRGAPVGFSYLVTSSFTQFRAVVWKDDLSGERVPVDLEPLPGFTDALAYAGNARARIVGEVTNGTERTPGGLIVRRAVVWEPRRRGDFEVTDLGVPDGYETSTALDVNERGEIVGTAQRVELDGNGNLVLHGDVVVWRKGYRFHGAHRDCGDWQPEILPSSPDYALNLNPAINEWGAVVAEADARVTGQPTRNRALLWVRGRRGEYRGPFELSIPEGFTDALATDVNDEGVILGTAILRDATGLSLSRPVLWRPRRRCGYEGVVLEAPDGVALVNSARLNDRGDVVGSAPLPPTGTTGALLWEKTAQPCRWRGHPKPRLER
jgi:hypothetical protein